MPERFKPTDHTPFNDRLVKANYDENISDLRRLKYSPEQIVRAVAVKELEQFSELETLNSNGSEKSKIKALQEHLAKCRALFDELNDTYDICIPKFYYVIGEAPPKPKAPGTTIYTAIKEVQGTNVDNYLKLEDSAIPLNEVEQLIAKLLNYITHKFILQEPFLSDIIRLDQYLYGTCEGIEKNSIILVDTDPLYQEFDVEPAYSGIDGYFIYYMRTLMQSMRFIETKSGTRLDYARTILIDCWESIGATYPAKSQSAMRQYNDLKKIFL